MRPNVVAIFSVVALAAAAALAVQQSPNFTSQTTGFTILTADAADYHSVVVPLPYREQPRTIRAPVPETEIATAWSTSAQPAGHPESMSGMTMEPSAGQQAEPPAVSRPTSTSADAAPERPADTTPAQTTSAQPPGGRR
ncbi:hypothetical protein QRX60_29445 [Amycolatopsis mongoliensis]|uniref:Secreted protein n=1 Tax=Amycolatopsis mongoliensis TaxID=715475 RepID=A0A9Y2JIV6_9PSEU|nr:hypothetical protein [Amycolatopsis sp. 4-36]WIX98191.1 hypothetical protein QRX60_29445 [Amycolatopsis sp. 4-36]